jgi:hypothetical protein
VSPRWAGRRRSSPACQPAIRGEKGLPAQRQAPGELSPTAGSRLARHAGLHRCQPTRQGSATVCAGRLAAPPTGRVCLNASIKQRGHCRRGKPAGARTPALRRQTSCCWLAAARHWHPTYPSHCCHPGRRHAQGAAAGLHLGQAPALKPASGQGAVEPLQPKPTNRPVGVKQQAVARFRARHTHKASSRPLATRTWAWHWPPAR